VSKLLIEPAVVLLAGACCLVLPREWIGDSFENFRVNPFALYLLVAGVVLFFYQLYCYMYRRNLMLDEKDAQIIAEVRERLHQPAQKLGVSTYKGVSYTILGGKNEWMKRQTTEKH
jgi:hypothetical protein